MRKRQRTVLLLLSTLVVLGTTSGIALSLRNTSERVRSASIEAFREAIRSGDFTSSELAIREYKASFRATDLLALVPFPRTPFSRRRADQLEKEGTTLSQVTTLLSTLKQGTILREEPPQQEPFTIQEVKPLALLLSEHIEGVNLLSQLSDLLEQRDKIIRHQSELKNIESAEEGIWSRLTLLKNDFRELLQLSKREDSEEDSIELYRSGFLQGLPLLPELPIPPETPQELAVALRELGLPLPPLSASDFNQRTTKLREALETTVAELDKSNERSRLLANEIELLEKSIEQTYIAIREELLAEAIVFGHIASPSCRSSRCSST
jgi:hypothetical protein